MKTTTTTYECDATGAPIPQEHRHDMLAVTLLYSHQRPTATTAETIHLAPGQHQFPYDRHDGAEYTAYIDADGDVVMVAEETWTGERYYGNPADDAAIAALVETLETEVVADAE